jgi:hypothetical protein
MKAAKKTQAVAKTTQIYTNKAIEQLEALSGELTINRSSWPRDPAVFIHRWKDR